MDFSGRNTLMPRKRFTGFTLIELLIVVAIIAILAGIAMVNYLEAQTRSKASRSRADMRTVVTAIEMYRVDWGGYPTYHYANSTIAPSALEFHIGGTVPAWGVPDPNWNGRNPITTPVAYITTMPKDTFANRGGSDPEEVREYLYVNWRYAILRCPDRAVTFGRAMDIYGEYRLHSRGPDGDGPDTGLPWDPTNGTRSDGDITYGPKTNFDHFVPFPP